MRRAMHRSKAWAEVELTLGLGGIQEGQGVGGQAEAVIMQW